MKYPVLNSASYILVNTPDMVIHNGTTQTTERLSNPDSEYLRKIPSHIRKYEEVLNYIPNQVYIGNMNPSDLRDKKLPWYDLNSDTKERYGKFGEIMPQDEFIGLLKISDSFNLVLLEKSFTNDIKNKLSSHKLLSKDVYKLGEGNEIEKIKNEIEKN
ncbi:MAG TPA: glycine reductase, partial [Clostridiales bacterium]|nr:glycine reductase [Clostridiales bacterium]